MSFSGAILSVVFHVWKLTFLRQLAFYFHLLTHLCFEGQPRTSSFALFDRWLVKYRP